MKTDYLVFIGRFSPFHLGHLRVVREALKRAEHLIMLIGSSPSARCPRAPFTFEEREEMITRSIDSVFGEGTCASRVSFLPIRDYNNDTRWLAKAQRLVESVVLERHGETKPSVGLIGHSKDHSSYYLKKFPDWSEYSVEVEFLDPINATDIRNDYFVRDETVWEDDDRLPSPVNDFLREFEQTEGFDYVLEWYEFDRAYQPKVQGFGQGKPEFVVQTMAADPVVVHRGHILLIRRKSMPGRGLLALPGGHVEPWETFRSAAIRELKEETQISDSRGTIPAGRLESFIDDRKDGFIDNPYRSSRARVVTKAFLFNLPETTERFKVKGDDDAEMAQWVKFGDIDIGEMFEDHAQIIEYMVGDIFD